MGIGTMVHKGLRAHFRTASDAGAMVRNLVHLEWREVYKEADREAKRAPVRITPEWMRGMVARRAASCKSVAILW